MLRGVGPSSSGQLDKPINRHQPTDESLSQVRLKETGREGTGKEKNLSREKFHRNDGSHCPLANEAWSVGKWNVAAAILTRGISPEFLSTCVPSTTRPYLNGCICCCFADNFSTLSILLKKEERNYFYLPRYYLPDGKPLSVVFGRTRIYERLRGNFRWN